MRISHLIPVFIIIASLFACTNVTEKPVATFNVATYNIRQLNESDSLAGNSWTVRYPVIARLVRFHGFDIFGTQEGFKRQLEELKDSLPGYDYIGCGREDGKDSGEHSAIFYRTDLFEVIDNGDFWLSETPDTPSIGWDAVLPRICSWGHFRHIDSGREFLFFNLHMDHIGKQARIESALLVQEKLKEFGEDLPTFLTGDFNVDQTHQSYSALTSTGRLADSYEKCGLRYAPNGTFNSYHTEDYTDSRIDHIFVSPDVQVDKYGVLTDTYRTPIEERNDSISKANDVPTEITLRPYTARVPSDHFPVMVQVSI